MENNINFVEYSPDQIHANVIVTELLLKVGVDLKEKKLLKETFEKKNTLISIIGRAGSGKTLLLSDLVKSVRDSGVSVISADYSRAVDSESRSLSILAPTNKAASVLRNNGVPATTIHRILYTPLYDPEFEKIAEWLVGTGKKPVIEGVSSTTLDKAYEFYLTNKSVPASLASIGLKGSDFIKGWKRREDPLDIAFVDEASMLDDQQLKDLSEIFSTLILFGDPAQLPPVVQSGEMIFDNLADHEKIYLSRVHRQSEDSPILDLAHALGEPNLTFKQFEDLIRDISTRDDRVVCSHRVNSDLMSRSPVLVWRNKTRVRLIQAYRLAFGALLGELIPGEPLICDGIELPIKHRKKRIDLEARGLVKGAQVIYLGPGKKPGFSKLHVLGAEDPRVSAASIIKIETTDAEEPFIPFAARMGASFLHGAAITIHKSQGSQWPTVQVFAPDIFAAASSGREEAGQPLWKRLAYVAITRAQNKVIWVERNRLERPSLQLGYEDLLS
ncbi:MAG: AAA family ATPase [Rhodobacteraceae bacterium]|jgi:exodeoxyribonuclease-5|nr:AAA family ATPase [Paracoccaceae bacterium]MBT6437052.1 AAA family ATPase [Paracoccaceae bacterium]|tara:strand:+ start:2901 stop:4400 length:1500 start_codon:yes stop_codon:yes gene_type:complete